MASVRWSTEHVVAEHKDLQASAIAVNCNGEFALLAGRRTLAILHLDKPSEVVKRLQRSHQKYDVPVAEWCPISSREESVALASGDKLEIYRFGSGNLVSEVGFRAHTRNITDINWHKEDQNIIATSSIDSSISIWDTRDIRRPSHTLKAVASAFQVKWNRHNSNIIASAHDNDLRIWDVRKTKTPIRFVTAHVAKIYSLDWSPNNESQLVTSANDCTVKLFDISKSRKEENIITICTQTPVWRTCCTPFGDGIVTVLVPQLNRGESSLLLWSLQDTSTVAHTFIGHSDLVLGVEWRKMPPLPSNLQDHQMVTWSRDNSLRIWKIDQDLQKLCGQEELDLTDVCNDEEEDCDTSEVETYKSGESDSQEGKDSSLTPGSGEVLLSPRLLHESLKQHTDNKESMDKPSPPASLELDSQSKLESSKIEEVKNQECLDHLSSSSSSQIATPSTPGSQGNSSQMSTPTTLQQEFNILNTNKEYFQAKSVTILNNLERRSCTITAKHGNHVLELAITCPSGYPKIHPPNFRFTLGTTFDTTIKNNFIKGLRALASKYFKKKKPCLEPCIEYLITQLSEIPIEDRPSSIDVPAGGTISDYFLSQTSLGTLDHVPFPRTSGARFSGSGLLVCFSKPKNVKKCMPCGEAATPRSLSALGACLNKYNPQVVSSVPTSPKYNYMYTAAHSPSDQFFTLSNYFYQERSLSKSKRNKNDDDKNKKNCVIYDVSALFPLSKQLGEAYVLDDKDLVKTCTVNRDAAVAVGRKDLVQVWSLAAEILSLKPCHGLSENSKNPNLGTPWAHHPFAYNTINSLIDHYIKEKDIQTVAMLTCVFGNKSQRSSVQPPTRKGRPESNSTGGSPYNTIHGIKTNSDSWLRLGEVVRHNRSNSEGSVAPDNQRATIDADQLAQEATADADNSKILFLDPRKSKQYEEIRRAYSDVLYQWGLLMQRTMIMKYMSQVPAPVLGGDFMVDCHHCHEITHTPLCKYCSKRCFYCAYCNISVTGSSIFCIVCRHGGHTHHIKEWFMENNECPTGCGCLCMEEMKQL